MFTKEQLSKIVTAELETLIQLNTEDNKKAFTTDDVSWQFRETLETEILESYDNPEVEEAIELYFEWNTPSENQSVEELFGQHLAFVRMSGKDFGSSLAEDEVNQIISNWAKELGKPDMYLGEDMRVHATW